MNDYLGGQMSKTIEQKYRKLSDIEHVLLRPGMYCGSIKPKNEDVFLLDENGKFTLKNVNYNPAFLKIFDEIVSNSVDEHRRNPKLNEIKVIVDAKSNSVTVWDNGGIPVVKHAEYDEWVPEMIFSNLKSGSNFNDDEERLVAGTNGVGSTLTNIFSLLFRVRTADKKHAFQQSFSNNMRERTPAKVLKWDGHFTEILFKPDLQRFGMNEIDESHVEMMRKRCIDLAACNPKMKISFNGVEYNFKSFNEYCSLYSKPVAYEESSRWRVAISPSNGSFTQVSFVNAVETKDGGTHIDHVMNQILEWLREKVKKKHKIELRPAELKNHFTLYVQADIVNPAFSSQTKEKMITESRDFGSQFKISDKSLKDIFNSEIVQRILDWAEQKALAEERKKLRELNKTISKEKVLKLVDAKSKDRESCTLSLYEGDCLEENTEVIVFRPEAGSIKVKIKDVKVGDHVITHTNSLKEVVAKSSKISKTLEIKTHLGIIKTSAAHRMWVYDLKEKLFKFVRADELTAGRHKLVKNKLSTVCMFMRIIDTVSKQDNIIISCDDDVIVSTESHKFAIFDIDDQKFKMIFANELIKNRHYIVLNYTN